MKKVLILTYYWPPTGGVGVQRWLKFTKYMKNFGWEPIIYTPSNPTSIETDTSTLKDIPHDIKVLKRNVWEPYAIYNKLRGIKKNEKIATGFLQEKKSPKLIEKAGVWLRGNFFIPDARMFFIKPSIKFLNNFLKTEKIDAIISTGTPHSMHLIALALKKKHKIPWLADFRDSWRLNDYYDKLMLTKWADNKHKKLEKKVLDAADTIVTVTPRLLEYYKEMGYNKTHLVTNGYDPDDYLYKNHFKKNALFTLCHTGSLNKDRNHMAFWKALKEISNNDAALSENIMFKQYGHTDIAVKNTINDFYLQKITSINEHLSRNDVIAEQMNADMLVLFINNTPDAYLRLTYKIFEYIAADKPILCIGPEDGDAAQVIKNLNKGCTAHFEDTEKIKNFILKTYQEFLNENGEKNTSNIAAYNFVNLTESICKLLNKI